MSGLTPQLEGYRGHRGYHLSHTGHMVAELLACYGSPDPMTLSCHSRRG